MAEYDLKNLNDETVDYLRNKALSECDYGWQSRQIFSCPGPVERTQEEIERGMKVFAELRELIWR